MHSWQEVPVYPGKHVHDPSPVRPSLQRPLSLHGNSEPPAHAVYDNYFKYLKKSEREREKDLRKVLTNLKNEYLRKLRHIATCTGLWHVIYSPGPGFSTDG